MRFRQAEKLSTVFHLLSYAVFVTWLKSIMEIHVQYCVHFISCVLFLSLISTASTGLQGIANVGNTCYMNAALQALAHWYSRHWTHFAFYLKEFFGAHPSHLYCLQSRTGSGLGVCFLLFVG